MPKEERVIAGIEKFVYYLAHRNASTSVPLMDIDELVGELWLEIAKGLKRYGDKPIDELLAILRKMCDNRVSELKYRYCVTHRKAAILAFPIDVIDVDLSEDGGWTGEGAPGWSWIVDNSVHTDDIVASRERVLETRRRLSPLAKDVFDVIIYGDENLIIQLMLSGIRAANVFKSGGSVRLRHYHIAEALATVSEKEVAEAMKEIRLVYAQVRSEYE